MKVHRYSEHQRRLWVHEMVHKTKTIKTICGEAEISRATLYNWLKEFSGEKPGEEQPATPPWEPNDRYKMLLSVLVKTDTDKAFSQRLARELVKRYNLTIAQACELVSLPEDAYKYRPRKPEVADKEVYAALVQALEENSNRSLDDCIVVLQTAHPDWAIKQVKRIYRQGRLYLKRTRIRRVAHLPETAAGNTEVSAASHLLREGTFWHLGLVQSGSSWLLFILDYTDGVPLNALAGEDTVSEADVLQLLKKAAEENGLPKKMRMPAVVPFTSRDITKWSWEKRVAVYNLSMAKPENLLEAGYIQDDIKQQLSIDENTTAADLQTTAASWLAGFAANNRASVNYFAKEPVS